MKREICGGVEALLSKVRVASLAFVTVTVHFTILKCVVVGANEQRALTHPRPDFAAKIKKIKSSREPLIFSPADAHDEGKENGSQGV